MKLIPNDGVALVAATDPNPKPVNPDVVVVPNPGVAEVEPKLKPKHIQGLKSNSVDILDLFEFPCCFIWSIVSK